MRVTLLVLVIGMVVGFQYNTTCNSTSYYFDTSMMECSPCKSNQKASADYRSCECMYGYAKTNSTRDFPVFECTECTSSVWNSYPSSDGYLCQWCPSPISCGCDPANYEALIEFAQNGDYLDKKQCVGCTVNFYTGPSSHSCQACSDPLMTRDSSYKCQCPSGYTMSQTKCVLNSVNVQNNFLLGPYSSTNAINVIYNSNQNSQGIGTYSISSSSTFSYYYVKAANDCLFNNLVQGCQILANMCVMQLYNQMTVVCQLYNYIASLRPLANSSVQDSGWKQNMAWLLYGRTSSQVLQSGTVTMQVTFDPNDSTKVNLMSFKLAQFAMDGTLIGFTDLTDQLILCPHSLQDSTNYRKFGTNVNINCELDLTYMITSAQTVFYELYFVDQNGVLQDVPVVIQNYMATDGSLPNQGSNPNQWKLVRRFFLYDNISGLDQSNQYADGTGTTKILQYLATAKIVFTLRNDKEEMIYIPYLVLKYKSRQTSYIQGTSSTDTISFSSIYTMDTSNFWSVAEGVFIGVNILVLLILIVKVYVWTKINPQKDSPTTYTSWFILTCIRMLISTWGFVCFWYLFGVTGYWFIFYKMQYNVYALVPPSSTFSTNYYPFEVLLYIVISAVIFNALYNIYRQCKLDILLIDWEKPNRDPFMKSAIEQNNSNQPAYKEYVSAWRYLFVANEFNELQTIRYMSLELTLVLFLFFLDGLGWNKLSRSEPDLKVGSSSSDTSPSNPVLRYFLTCSLLLVIGYGQYIIKKLFSIWASTPMNNFIDLCSISNISILVLDEFLHGYYIHGISPNGYAEQSLDELLESLNKEASGKSRGRGIVPEDRTGLQSFEVFIPSAIRKTYNNLAKFPVDNEIRDFLSGRQESSGIPRMPESLPQNINIQKLQEIRLELNRRLKIYIAGLVKDSNTQILGKTAWQRFFSMPPADLSLLDGTPYFYRDPGIGFETSFLMGKEFTFLLMDIMIFELFDYTISNTYVAVLLTYLIDKTIIYIRKKAGEWNLSRKTLVNSQFLL